MRFFFTPLFKLATSIFMLLCFGNKNVTSPFKGRGKVTTSHRVPHTLTHYSTQKLQTSSSHLTVCPHLSMLITKQCVFWSVHAFLENRIKWQTTEEKGPATQFGTWIKITRGLKARADISFQVLQRFCFQNKTKKQNLLLNPPIKPHKRDFRIAPVAWKCLLHLPVWVLTSISGGCTGKCSTQ